MLHHNSPPNPIPFLRLQPRDDADLVFDDQSLSGGHQQKRSATIDDQDVKDLLSADGQPIAEDSHWLWAGVRRIRRGLDHLLGAERAPRSLDSSQHGNKTKKRRSHDDGITRARRRPNGGVRKGMAKAMRRRRQEGDNDDETYGDSGSGDGSEGLAGDAGSEPPGRACEYKNERCLLNIVAVHTIIHTFQEFSFLLALYRMLHIYNELLLCYNYRV